MKALHELRDEVVAAAVNWLAPEDGWTAPKRLVGAVTAYNAAVLEAESPVGSDSVVGRDRAPDRYMGQERETVDRMRDRCREAAGFLIKCGIAEVPSGSGLDLGDWAFSMACETHSTKYEDRAGRKGSGGDAAIDLDKAKWWGDMASHTRGDGDDPRSERTGFEPYEYTP